MSETTKVVRGIIRPDGSLELAEPLSWPPGEVEVTLRPVADLTKRFVPRDSTKKEIEDTPL